MATIDDLTPVLASAVSNTDLMYVGLPLNSDPDRQILVSEVKTLFLPDDGVTNVKLRDSAALSVIGRSTNSTGDPADIASGTDGHVLRQSGTALGFGTVTTAGIGDAQVTNVKVAAGVDAAKIANGTVSNTEFQYLDGVTSSIQAQLSATAGRIFAAGRSGSGGAENITPSGWTIAETSAGSAIWNITHNFGNKNYAVSVTTTGSHVYYASVNSISTNSFQISTRTISTGANAANVGFSIVVIKV